MSHHFNNGYQNFDPLIFPQINGNNNNNINSNSHHDSNMSSNGNYNSVFYCTESPLDDHSYYTSFPTEVAYERVIMAEQTIDNGHIHANNNYNNNIVQNAKLLQQQQQQQQHNHPLLHNNHHQAYIPVAVPQLLQPQKPQQPQPQKLQHTQPQKTQHPQPQQHYNSSSSTLKTHSTSSSSTTSSSNSNSHNRPNYIHIPSSNFDLDDDDDHHLPAAVPLDYGAVMDSVCREQEALGGLRRARVDRTIFDDDRVFANLLRNEHRYMPSSHYFKTLQSDLKPFMRKMVTEWMLEVSNWFLDVRVNAR